MTSKLYSLNLRIGGRQITETTVPFSFEWRGTVQELIVRLTVVEAQPKDNNGLLH